MPKGMRKPAGKHTLTLHFDSKIGIDAFRAWYLDGGGEQDSRYYSDSWGKDWMYLKVDEDACPKCEYDDTEELNSEFYDNRTLREVNHTCTNCNHQFKVKSPYRADGT